MIRHVQTLFSSLVYQDGAWAQCWRSIDVASHDTAAAEMCAALPHFSSHRRTPRALAPPPAHAGCPTLPARHLPNQISPRSRCRVLTCLVLSRVYLQAGQQDDARQEDARREDEVEPPDPAVDPHAHGQHHSLQCEAPPLAPDQDWPLN